MSSLKIICLANKKSYYQCYSHINMTFIFSQEILTGTIYRHNNFYRPTFFSKLFMKIISLANYL